MSVLKRYTGSEWEVVGAAQSGSSGPVVLAEQTLASAAAYIEFASISQSYRHLQIEGRLRSDRSGAASDIVYMRVGSAGSLDTGNNYAYLLTTPTAIDTSTSAQPQMQIGRVAGATATPSGCFSDFSCTIHDYKTTTWYRTIRGSSISQIAAEWIVDAVAHWQNTAAAINIIRFYPATGPNFIAGSQLRLIGIPAP